MDFEPLGIRLAGCCAGQLQSNSLERLKPMLEHRAILFFQQGWPYLNAIGLWIHG